MQPRKKQPAITRQAILDAADHEFSRKGFSGAGLGGIVARAELTKGALFHHFPDKRTLAAAWITERLGGALHQLWITPLDDTASLDQLRKTCQLRAKELTPADTTSALVAVAAEIADLDPLLGDALSSVFDEWHSAFASLLERGKAAGWIHASIKPEVEAALFVSAFAGFTVTLRTSRNPAAREHFITGMEGYLETLRVPQD